jgi:hypothetical protein
MERIDGMSFSGDKNDVFEDLGLGIHFQDISDKCRPRKNIIPYLERIDLQTHGDHLGMDRGIIEISPQ